jgi:tetratricopeptide (TPR) repeat protein
MDELQRKLDALEEARRDGAGADAPSVSEMFAETIRGDSGRSEAFSELEEGLRERGLWDDHVEALEARVEWVTPREPWDERLEELHDRLREAYESRGDWPALLDLLRSQLDLLDEGQRTEHLHEMLELARRRIEDPRAPVPILKQLLERKPDDPVLLQELEEVLRDVDDVEALAGVLTRRATVVDSEEQALDLLTEAAEIYDVDVDRPKAARDAWERIRALDPKDERATERLEALHLELGDVDGLRALYDHVDRSPEAMAEQFVELGRRQIQEAGDTVTAEEAFRAALQVDERSRTAVDRLATILRSQQRWLDLVELLERRVDVVEQGDPEEALSRLETIAELYRDRIGDGHGAADAYERMMELGPLDAGPAEALSDLYREQARWEELADILERRFEATTSDEERTALAFRLAETFRRHTQEPDRALDFYRHVLDVVPGHPETIGALESLYEQGTEARPQIAALLEDTYTTQQRWRDLIGLLLRRAELTEHHADASDTLERAFDIADVTLDDEGLAFELAMQWMRRMPEHTRARGEVERVGRSVGGWERVVELYRDVLDEGETDESIRAALLTELGDIFEKRLGEPTRARRAYQGALEIDPAQPEAVDGLERVLMRLDDARSLGDLWWERAERETDDADRVALLARTARLEEHVCQRPERAYELWEEVLVERPSDAEAFSGLERLLTRMERWDELADLYRRRIDDIEDTRREADRKSKLAELMETRFDDVAGAIETYGEVLAASPGHRGALRGLEGLRRDLAGRPGRWRAERLRVISHLTEHYDPQTDWRRLVSLENEKRDLVEDVSRQADLLARQAELIDTYGGDDVERGIAVRRLATAVGLMPDDAGLKRRLSKLAEDLDAWTQVPAALLEALEETRNEVDRAALLELVGDVYARKLDDGPSAVTAYRSSLDVHHRDSVLESLEETLRRQKRWADLADVLEQRASRTEGDQRRRVLHWLADLYDNVLDRPGLATETYRRLLEAVADDPEAQLQNADGPKEAVERLEGTPDGSA